MWVDTDVCQFGEEEEQAGLLFGYCLFFCANIMCGSSLLQHVNQPYVGSEQKPSLGQFSLFSLNEGTYVRSVTCTIA